MCKYDEVLIIYDTQVFEDQLVVDIISSLETIQELSVSRHNYINMNMLLWIYDSIDQRITWDYKDSLMANDCTSHVKGV